MESIKFLITFLFKIAIVAFFAAIAWWFVVAFFPTFSPKTVILGRPATPLGKDDGWLPSPRSFGGLFSNVKKTDTQNNVYVSDPIVYEPSIIYTSNNTYDSNGYLTYTYSTNTNTQQGNKVTNTSQKKQVVNDSIKSMYVRNISIYQGGHVYQGLSFVGEARNTMFLEGKFPVILVDNTTSKIVSVSFAEAVTDWTVPGWTRFKVTIGSVAPRATPCTMLFEQARVRNSQIPPQTVSVPVMCN